MHVIDDCVYVYIDYTCTRTCTSSYWPTCTGDLLEYSNVIHVHVILYSLESIKMATCTDKWGVFSHTIFVRV